MNSSIGDGISKWAGFVVPVVLLVVLLAMAFWWALYRGNTSEESALHSIGEREWVSSDGERWAAWWHSDAASGSLLVVKGGKRGLRVIWPDHGDDGIAVVEADSGDVAFVFSPNTFTVYSRSGELIHQVPWDESRHSPARDVKKLVDELVSEMER